MGGKRFFQKKKSTPGAPNQTDVQYRDLLKNQKLPILTLDGRWHELFPDYAKSRFVKELEKKLNTLVKRQGKLVTDNKDMKKLKKTLMDKIVENMKVAEGAGTELDQKKQDASQKLIKDINQKMKDADEELLSLPYEIKKTNEDLMMESMKVCYHNMKENERKIAEHEQEIIELRNRLKDVILAKQDMEAENDRIYTYMHAIFGPNVMEILDRINGGNG